VEIEREEEEHACSEAAHMSAPGGGTRPLRREEAIAELTKPGAPFVIAEANVNGVAMRVWATAPASLRAVLEGT
jgi:hypothetical protein